MLKILYAASASESAWLQLDRFSRAIVGRPIQLKVAAYQKSSPANMNIDWTLDSLQDIFKPDLILPNNDNFNIYLDQVKHFKPDLIISDLEYYTSEVAISLGINLWQVSSSLINYALPTDYKYNLGIFKKYAFLLSRVPTYHQRLTNIQVNANYNFIYSHFGDCANPPPIKDNYQWIRPYHLLGKPYKPCQHNVVSAMLGSHKPMISALQNYDDVVCFTDSLHESFDQIKLKNLSNQEEYYCNIKNSDIFFCSGQSSFLADAFYNGKFSVVIEPSKEDFATCAISEKLKLSGENLLNYQEITPSLNPGIRFLHEKLYEFYFA